MRGQNPLDWIGRSRTLYPVGQPHQGTRQVARQSLKSAWSTVLPGAPTPGVPTHARGAGTHSPHDPVPRALRLRSQQVRPGFEPIRPPGSPGLAYRFPGLSDLTAAGGRGRLATECSLPVFLPRSRDSSRLRPGVSPAPARNWRPRGKFVGGEMENAGGLPAWSGSGTGADCVGSSPTPRVQTAPGIASPGRRGPHITSRTVSGRGPRLYGWGSSVG